MGPLWMLVAGFLFGCMGVFVKLGSRYFSSVELVFYRSLFGLVVIFAFARSRGLSVTTRNWRKHVWRGVSGLVSLAMMFYCISVLPLATAVTLNYTSPLFLTLFTTVILKEKFHWPLACAVALGFAGAVLLLRPTLDENQWQAGVLGLISGVFAAIAYLNVKHLSLLGEPEWRVVFYFTLISTLLTGIWLLAHVFHPITLANAWLLLGLGATATIAQLALTRAYRRGRTLVVGTLAYSTVVFSSLWGLVVWGEIPPVSGWFAMALIVASGALSMRAVPRPVP